MDLFGSSRSGGLRKLPFSTGEPIEVIVLANATTEGLNSSRAAVHPFEGLPVVFLQDPFEPACPEEDWEVLR